MGVQLHGSLALARARPAGWRPRFFAGGGMIASLVARLAIARTRAARGLAPAVHYRSVVHQRGASETLVRSVPIDWGN
jgi:hypothetical protein